MRLAVIGGTGVYDSQVLQNNETKRVDTPFGEAYLETGEIAGRQVIFMARHGRGHSIPPHRINYRANIWALKSEGVQGIIATNAVGSVNRVMRPGDFVVIDQFLDFTKTRAQTFFDGADTPVFHVDVTDPYCPNLREALTKKGRELRLPIHERGCYACFEGPRYESAAEIRMVSILRGDLVGMTNLPEVILAREAGICYAAVCLVTNMGAGIAANPLTHAEVSEMMQHNLVKLRQLVFGALELVEKGECGCPKDIPSLPGLDQ